MQSTDESLKRLATELLHQLYLTFIPLQLRAVAMETLDSSAVKDLCSQDNMSLAMELHLSSVKVYHVCVKLLSMIESESKAVDDALRSLGSWPSAGPERKDLELVGNQMSGNVERALKVLSPNLPFDIFQQDQRLPHEK